MSRLSRWSRRKLSEETDVIQADEPELVESVQTSEQTTQEPDGEPPSAPLEPGSLDATLPDPDNLPAGSDFKAFMQAGVSDALRRRALRRMFSGGHYGIRDGLDDYDHDYRQLLKPLASEMAQRLRQWTRKLEESEPEPELETNDPVERAEFTTPEEPNIQESAQELMPSRDEDTVDAQRELETSAENDTSTSKGGYTKDGLARSR
ncbi:DUF3306 domain-containing protein [Halomonas alkalisoli]|uniref:DUF3306 domain-containing protein n=1 Tax=Halomonas alkalisoli TaxID=2907158 RepID=UPI001F24BD6E|nr:DUF3306 domain-containing protein [Halomonas alkalisoli]MCE9684201.1 DUF3306 domain-containing protein [Halomonas alkalisoli]